MFDLRNLPLITFEPDYIMKTYTRNEEYFKRYDSLGGAPIYWPKHTCSTCSAPIRSEFDGPAGECYDCGHQGRDLSPISSIHSVAAYFPKKYWGDAEGHIINQLIKFGRELFDAKDREYTEKMGNLLHLGIINGGYTSYDVSVIPPSSSDGPNHMTPKAEFVEDKTDISFEDPIVEVENTGESKKKGAQKRWEDSKDNYRCETSYEGERVLILDDIVTTCSTVYGVANAIEEQGAEQIGVVSMARSVSLSDLTYNRLIDEK